MDIDELQRIESKMRQYAREYTDDRASMRARVERLSARTCYASCGKNMGFRGMYSPSLYLRYVISNAYPGKLLKKQPPKFNGHYLYAFDEDDRIIYAKQYAQSSEPDWAIFEEFIFYHEGDQVSIVFECKKQSPDYVTLCEFQEGLPSLYALFGLHAYDELFTLQVERYEYTRQVLSQIFWWDIWKQKNQYEGVSHFSKIRFDEQGNATIMSDGGSLLTLPADNRPLRG